MVVRESQSRYTPRPPSGRAYTPTSPPKGKGKAKGFVPPMDPSLVDTLVEGVRVVFDDWTDDVDRSLVRQDPTPAPDRSVPDRSVPDRPRPRIVAVVRE